MRKHRLKPKPASKGEPSLLALTLPAAFAASGEELDIYAIPIEFRMDEPLDVLQPRTEERGGIASALAQQSTAARFFWSRIG